MANKLTIRQGDVIGTFGTISGSRVERIIGQRLLLDTGEEVRKSDVHTVQTDNLDGTITETRYDGVIRTFDEDDR